MDHTKNLFRAQMSHISKLEKMKFKKMRGFYSTDGMDPHGETKTVEYIPPVPR